MIDSRNGRIEYHSWTSPAHDFTDLFTLFGSITMCGAVLTSGLTFTILAMIETTTGKLCQMLIVIRHSILFQVVTAVQLYHPADGLLFSLNPGHITSIK